ncbi:MAG: metallophosphoesterase [Chlamydiia bacterium]
MILHYNPMNIWAFSDLHLSFGNPEKSMEVFGPAWHNYGERIKQGWLRHIHDEDLVLIPGDLSWGKNLDQALIDLEWIHALPGTKVIIKGNHDHWWDSAAKMTKALPSSIHFIQNNTFEWKDVTIGGARLWDTSEYNFKDYIEFVENPRENKQAPASLPEDQQKIFVRELQRLRLSLSAMDPNKKIRIALTHYPPIGADLATSRTSQILEEFHIDLCVFGHLHSVKKRTPFFGKKNGVQYVFACCDFLDFIPLKLL